METRLKMVMKKHFLMSKWKQKILKMILLKKI